MRFRTIPFAIALLLAAVATDVPTVNAQNLRSRQPLQRVGRWLGQGWSTGYHHRNPGPNTDYYNPYTAHNSMLISRQPGYQAHQHQYHNQPMAPGVPYSVYAPTIGTSQNDWTYGHGQSIQPSFVPTDQDSDEDEDDDNRTEDESDDDLSDVSISSDPEEPGSIRGSDGSTTDAEDADFEESSTDSSDGFDGGVDADNDERVEATKTGFRRPLSENSGALDFSSFMVN